ncbi:unnamed protein product, partial [Coregonus sp. 'balchen']
MDKSMIKTILIRNLHLNGELFDALTVAEDDTWRRIRSVLSPSFTSGRLKEMFGIMKQHSSTLLNGMKKQADKDQAIELKECSSFDLFNPLFLLVVLFPFTGPILEKMKFSFFPTAVTDFFYASLAKIKSGRGTGNT